jgi:DNA-binding MarR family transcriptional regulator
MVDAFKKEIEEEREPPKGPVEGVKETLTMNPRRQEIFQYLCTYPCTRLARIGKDLDLSMAAAKWHLEKLAEKEFITKHDVAGETVYCPVDMIDKSDIRVLAAVNHERGTPVLRAIVQNPGITLKELCEVVQLNPRTVLRHASAMERLGLIETIKDGKFKRFYKTERIEKINDGYRKRAGKFRKGILKMLKGDGVSPKVVRATDRALHVKITAGTKKSVLELNCQPFASVMEFYKGL